MTGHERISIFGAKRIPELARSLGRASYEFKKAKDEIIKETAELKDAAEGHAATEDQASAKDAASHEKPE